MQSLRNAALTAFAALAVTPGAWAADKPTGLPIADPPAVLGEPYMADGIAYAPADTPFDDVGYAGLDDRAGPGISVSHRTLPLPSYVEITALDSGRTILTRVERRGPMSGTQLVTLSAAAFAQLEQDPARPLAVRVRRVNPQEYESALLRTNQRAPERLVTPGQLLEVLRKLLARKSAPASVPVVDPDLIASVPVSAARSLKPAPGKPVAGRPTLPKPVAARPVPVKTPPTKPVAARVADRYSVQVGTFANRANAEATAKKLCGRVSGSGKLWRVQLGPFTTRALADAGLARAKKAGFGDARIVSPGK